METTRMMIFLDEKLPKQYADPKGTVEEVPVKDIDELKSLYQTKYGSFGEIQFYIYRAGEKEAFINGLSEIFSKNDMAVTVDATLVEKSVDALVPLIAVDGDIISRGVYPDLTILRGGSNSVNRGGTGAHG